MKSMKELIDDMIYYNDILDDSDITNYYKRNAIKEMTYCIREVESLLKDKLRELNLD